MATGTYCPAIPQQYFDNSGNPLISGTITSYIAGTSTTVATYSDINLTVQNANPMTLDGSGRPPANNIFLVPGSSYKFVIKDSLGSTIATYDNVLAVPTSSSSLDVTGTAGEALTAGQAVYLSDGSGGKVAGQWYKADAANTYSSTLPEVGIVPNAITSGSSGTIRLAGGLTGLASLTVGAEYFVGTAGAITSTAPANRRHLGHADTTSTLILTGDPPPFLAVPVTVANGGTGLSTTPTDGQLLIGKTSITGYALATPTATGITVTAGSGTLAFSVNSRILDKVTTEQDVTATTTETSVYSFSVPGGTLSTSNVIRLTLTGYAAVNAGGDTLNMRVKFGGTTIAAGAMTLAAGALGGTKLEAFISANNATNSQRTLVRLSQASTGATTDGTYDTSPGIQLTAANSTLAIDTTSAQTLQVTVQWGSNSATNHYKRWLTMTEVLS